MIISYGYMKNGFICSDLQGIQLKDNASDFKLEPII